MKRMCCLALLGVVLSLPATSADGQLSGTWRLTTMDPLGRQENTNYLLKLESKDGNTAATLAATSPAMSKGKTKATLKSFTVTGNRVRAVIETNVEQVFEGRIAEDGKSIKGALSDDKSISAAYLAPTEMTKIESQDVVKSLGIEQMDTAAKLTAAIAPLVNQGKKSKDADEKAKLQKEAAEATRVADLEVPKLYLQTMQQHTNTYSAGRAALLILQRKQETATARELKSWAELASKSASAYGPIWTAEVGLQISTALKNRKSSELALQYAEAADRALDETCPIELQLKVLQLLSSSLADAGRKTESAAVEARLEKLEKIVDAEYVTKVPPFKGEKFAGRKGQSERVVLMELFTGAQCPPCVAADVAFDVLQKNYTATELVLLQYHLHIPGPDPMTNADTEARAKYYGARSTPSTFFNGESKAGGGGAMNAAEKKYAAYRKIIDPLLEEPAGCKVTASAKRNGDKINIQAAVTGVEKPGKTIKLRLVLAEETIRFVGSNKLRFHHHVVRAMPGGAAGVPVMTATFSTNNEVDLSSLRNTLVNYLDDYAANKRPFPQAGRPMSFDNLRVIAFVQDDETNEILQAVQTEVH